MQVATDPELRQQNAALKESLAKARDEIKRLQAEVSSLTAKGQASQPAQKRHQEAGLSFRHETRLLCLAAAAQERYAGENLVISERDTWPRKNDVIDWLQEQEPGLSKKVAEVIDTIAMPFSRGK